MNTNFAKKYTLRLAIPRVEDRPLDAIGVNDSTANCVPFAIGACIILQWVTTIAVDTTIVTMIGKTRGYGVVQAGHTIETRRLR